MAETTDPPALVLRSVLVTPEMARRVVVALVVVEFPRMTRSPEMVEDAVSMPVEKLRTVVVAFEGKR